MQRRFRTRILESEAKIDPYRAFNFLLRRAADIKTHPVRPEGRQEKKNSTHRAALSLAITRIAQVTAALKQQPAIAAADPALPSPAARDACYATALITRYRRLQQPLRLCILHNQQPPTASTCSSSAHASTSSPSATPPQPSHTRQHTPTHASIHFTCFVCYSHTHSLPSLAHSHASHPLHRNTSRPLLL